MKTKVQAIEMICVLSDCTVTGLNLPDCYDKIAKALETSVDYQYQKKPELMFEELRFNLLAYARQKGFEQALTQAAEEYKNFIHVQQPSFFVDTSMNARMIAKTHHLTDIEIEINDKTEAPEPVEAPEKPKIIFREAPLKLVDFDWQTDAVTCAFCGTKLTSWHNDNSGCNIGYSDCSCKAYHEAKAYNVSLNK